MEGDLRIQDVARGEAFEFLFDGEPVSAYPGETVSAALLAIGRRVLRRTPGGEPRGLFCVMGICQECLVVVDGVPGVRACMTEATPGLRVETQKGLGA
jgi:aerobic-type carbon monoxide dehydrogenase small subunit (CoxS/CutS family)